MEGQSGGGGVAACRGVGAPGLQVAEGCSHFCFQNLAFLVCFWLIVFCLLKAAHRLSRTAPQVLLCDSKLEHSVSQLRSVTRCQGLLPSAGGTQAANTLALPEPVLMGGCWVSLQGLNGSAKKRRLRDAHAEDMEK